MTKMLIIGMGILFLCSGVLSATIINIPNDYPTIQQGIDASQDADTVLVQPGTYVENINYNGKNITVGSLFLTTADTSYISQTIIDGNQSGSVVTFESAEDTTAVLCGFTIQNGLGNDTHPYTGGGITCHDSSPHLQNLIVTYNDSDYMGGGIACYCPFIRMDEIVVCNNSAASMGGGISIICSYVEMYNCTIANNNKSGIYSTYSTISMHYVDIENNTDGGIYSHDDTEVYLEKVNIVGNSSQSGGGISSTYSDIILKNVVITDNTASDFGGGLCFVNNEPIFQDCIISNNVAEKGGGIYFQLCCVDIKTTVIENNVANYGGGIYNKWSAGIIDQVTIVSNNRGGIYADLVQGMTCNNSIVANNIEYYGIYNSGGDYSIQYSNFWNNSSGNFLGLYDSTGINVTTNANGDSCDIYYNIQMDPMFADPLTNDYHLQWCSPCIDAGDPNSPLDPDSTIVDMGAYYYHQNVAIDEPSISIEEYQIINFPNPFKTSTQISFSLPHPEKVKIQIYNLKGQLVETLLDENMQAGSHSLEWNAEKASSGIYFMKLLTKERAVVKKLIIIN